MSVPCYEADNRYKRKFKRRLTGVAFRSAKVAQLVADPARVQTLYHRPELSLLSRISCEEIIVAFFSAKVAVTSRPPQLLDVVAILLRSERRLSCGAKGDYAVTTRCLLRLTKLQVPSQQNTRFEIEVKVTRLGWL